jgi:hypothetical protein
MSIGPEQSSHNTQCGDSGSLSVHTTSMDGAAASMICAVNSGRRMRPLPRSGEGYPLGLNISLGTAPQTTVYTAGPWQFSINDGRGRWQIPDATSWSIYPTSSLAGTSDVYWPSTPGYNRSNGRCVIAWLSTCDQHARRHCTRGFRSKTQGAFVPFCR